MTPKELEGARPSALLEMDVFMVSGMRFELISIKKLRFEK
jgi:hypothetical protein